MPKKPVDPSFGKRLTQFRKERGLTMGELAKKLGVSTRSVFYYEKQAKQPPVHLITKMSEALNVSAEELLGIKQTKTNLDPKDAALWKHFQRAKTLPRKDRQIIIQFMKAVIDKNRKEDHPLK